MSQFLSLPPELQELTLVFTAVLGFPETIGALAQVCRSMRLLVYGAADQHLWREIYLSTFDDPRSLDEVDASLSRYNKLGDDPLGPKAFDWGTEFRGRIWSANFIRRATADPVPPTVKLTGKARHDRLFCPQADNDTWIVDNLRALESLLGVIDTAQPFPQNFVLSPNSDRCNLRAAHPANITFPPPPLAFTSPQQYNANGSGGITPSSQVVFSNQTYADSASLRWLEKVLGSGLPPVLTARMSGEVLPGGSQAVWETHLEAKLMRSLARLTASMGFMPIPQDDTPVMIDAAIDATIQPEANNDTPDARANDEDEDEDVEDGDYVPDDNTEDGSEDEEVGLLSLLAEAHEHAHPHGDPHQPIAGPSRDTIEFNPIPISIDMSILAQQRRTRRLGRMRVYNMRYLARERHWGPYLFPLDPVEGQLARPTAVPAEEDFLDPILAIFAEHEAGHPNHGNDDDSDEEDDQGAFPTHSAHPPLPTPSQLHVDWSYIAAARVVVEANLREAIGKDDLSGLLWLDRLRIGSSPKNSETEMECKLVTHDEEVDMVVDSKGKGKYCENLSDWAGVTGIWRRCVCWMDYRDLILHNLSSQFNDPTLQEAVRIVPIYLQVASYSPCEVPGYPNRPTIHVTGETVGPAGSASIRKVRGSVGMIADGSIRWTLIFTQYSASEDGPDEWVTEGVQVGDARSAMGVIGMWTGAQHERMDPLGPFWAWKVS